MTLFTDTDYSQESLYQRAITRREIKARALAQEAAAEHGQEYLPLMRKNLDTRFWRGTAMCATNHLWTSLLDHRDSMDAGIFLGCYRPVAISFGQTTYTYTNLGAGIVAMVILPSS
jgi:hypothetical protein